MTIANVVKQCFKVRFPGSYTQKFNIYFKKGTFTGMQKGFISQHIFISSTHSRHFNQTTVVKKKINLQLVVDYIQSDPKPQCFFKIRANKCIAFFPLFFLMHYSKLFQMSILVITWTIQTARNHTACTSFSCSVFRSFSFLNAEFRKMEEERVKLLTS